jgi:hypothetical protein
MKLLSGELLVDGQVQNVATHSYDEKNEGTFIMALVSICTDINVDIPIWTSMEEKILDRKKSVSIPLEEDKSLRIYLKN